MVKKWTMAGVWLTALGLWSAAAVPAKAASMFTSDERSRLVAYWNAPGRYVTGIALDPGQAGPWQVRLTPEASTWFLAYQRAVSSSRLPPTVDASAASGPAAAGSAPTAGWEVWVRTRLEYDRAAAERAADAANRTVQAPPVQPPGPPAPIPPAQIPPAQILPAPGLPVHPGPNLPAQATPEPIPDSLLQAVGNPPPFAAIAAPFRSVVTFDDGESFTYDDHVPCRPRFAYYRYPQGTIALGPMLRSMPEAALEPLFAAAGMSASEARVAMAVSRLEGGFESVNTYDTGCISIGFIQFISGVEGNGSLLRVLTREKAERPADFESDFARYGINVGVGGVLVVVDPATGAELSGPAAVQKTIADKRLTAPFQRAGRHSAAFRTAQIEMAKTIYWPADDPVSVNIGGTVLTGKISDVIHSEAGMATLFDRKVNTGTTALINDVIAKVMVERHLTALAQTAPFEPEIITDLKYRTDFLQDPSLSQPAPLPPGDAAGTGGTGGANGGTQAEGSPGRTGGLH